MDELARQKITVITSLIRNVFKLFIKNFGYVIVYLRKDIKKPLNQAKDPEVKERTYDAYYFICASELQD